MVDDTSVATAVRLDVWLDVACLFRTRSEAQKACHGGKIHVNGQAAKSHRQIRLGDEIRITRPMGRRQLVVVRQLEERHVPRAEARNLYEDRTPPPSPEEVEARRLERVFRASMGVQPSRPPSKRERRAILKLKGR
jgi:ribosome-associated heat shock protein Hsp15